MPDNETLFSKDLGTLLDFTKKRPSEIFNESILPTANQFFQNDEFEPSFDTPRPNIFDTLNKPEDKDSLIKMNLPN